MITTHLNIMVGVLVVRNLNAYLPIAKCFAGFLSNLRWLTRRVPEDAIGNSWQRELQLEIVDGTKSRLLFRYAE